MIRIIHANFGFNKVNSLGAMAASVKYEYYANFIIHVCCQLNLAYFLFFSIQEPLADAIVVMVTVQTVRNLVIVLYL